MEKTNREMIQNIYTKLCLWGGDGSAIGLGLVALALATLEAPGCCNKQCEASTGNQCCANEEQLPRAGA